MPMQAHAHALRVSLTDDHVKVEENAGCSIKELCLSSDIEGNWGGCDLYLGQGIRHMYLQGVTDGRLP